MADRVNVDFDLYRIRTVISERRSTIEADTLVPRVDPREPRLDNFCRSLLDAAFVGRLTGSSRDFDLAERVAPV